MPTTVLQSVFLIKANLSICVLPELEYCPIIVDGDDFIETDDGSAIVKFSDRTEKYLLNGDIKLYKAKPTMQECVINRDNKGMYYRFYEDGSVRAKDGNNTLYWSAPVECDYHTGDPADRGVKCHVCGSDCEGADYEKWQYCSRRCMVYGNSD